MNITIETARKILATVDAGLCSGLGQPKPGEMCVDAAVCYALGLPHGDDPKCEGEPFRAYKIRLNDACWSSNVARSKGMRDLAIATLGSLDLDGNDFTSRLSEQTIRQIVPIALRAEAKSVPSHAEKLEAAAVRCEQEGTLEAVKNACDAAHVADVAVVVAAARAARAARAAAAAAAADYAAAADAYVASMAATAESDRILTLSANIALGILRDMKAPGVTLLDQINAEGGGQ